MRFVIQTDPNVVELNWMWLPTFIGMHSGFKAEMEKVFLDKHKGRNITAAVLDEIHAEIIEYLLAKYPRKGLDQYLDALKYVEDLP